MRFIEKHFKATEVVAFEKELSDNRYDKVSLSDASVHPSMDGKSVYEAVKSLSTFKNLKSRLYADQGGICCYCGCRLEYPNHPQYVVEHVFPKEKNRSLAGEYENLLLSCRPTDEEEERRGASDSKSSLFFHCDKSKGSKVLMITPLQENCSNFFCYDEFGRVRGEGKADDTIKTLNLNCEWLTKRRLAAIEGELYDENDNLLSNEELIQRLKTIMNVDDRGLNSEFCFVIKSVIEGLVF